MRAPFDLEKALAGAKVVTRNDYPIKVIHCFDLPELTQPVIGVLLNSIVTFSRNGCFFESGEESINDIFLEIPEPKKYYLNIYESVTGDITGGVIRNSEEECARNVDSLEDKKHLKIQEIILEQP